MWYNLITMSKQCKKCQLQKELSQFNKRKSSKDGLDIYCKLCKANYTNIWKLNNPEKLKLSKKIADNNWYSINKDIKLKINKEWKLNNLDYSKEWHKEYKRNREKLDPNFKIANRLRARLWHALKGKKATCKFSEYIGCSIDELRLHIESLFEPGMTWDNYGEWELDYKEPLCDFDLTNIEELKKACNYLNLQPIWKKKHHKKTAKDLFLRKNTR